MGVPVGNFQDVVYVMILKINMIKKNHEFIPIRFILISSLLNKILLKKKNYLI